jgi:multiple antibiotic resistance protein
MRKTDILQAIVTVLSLINPVVCGTMFTRIEEDLPRKTQLADATKAAFAILVILTLAALFGARLLDAFGVSLDAFSVAGGGVLVWMGFSMLVGSSSSSAPSKETPLGGNPSITPLVLFGASPGAITGVITLAVAHSRTEIPMTALLAVLVASMITWIVMVLVTRLGKREAGGSFVSDTVRSFMGLIIIAMGVQFALTGVRSFLTVSG